MNRSGPSREERETVPLPRAGRARDDADTVIRLFELARKFPQEVLDEAGRASAAGTVHLDRRVDLRKEFVFTCDPVSAKDFDDALSISTDPSGNRVLGVHIADVSHYVRPGTALDVEAAKRSTSVYLLDRVVPMLPECLSNGICSLVPGEDRLAFSVFMAFDRDGRPVSSRFAKSIIKSKARFTYSQVMDAISGRGGRIPRKQAAAILAISALAQQLRKRRFAAGALDITTPEAEIELDSSGEMTGIEARLSDESHQMVEECMVAANEAVAKELWTHGRKILARFHGRPDPERIEMLRADLAAMGIKCGDLSRRKDMPALFARIRKSPCRNLASIAVLRAMKRAVYDAGTMGHFGLAKDFYAHFTSPIRRYPDLLLHRQLSEYISTGGGMLPGKTLSEAAKHCSAMEERADEAERSLKEIKKYRFLEKNPGPYDAVIGKVAKFGVFVDVPAIACGGFVHVASLSRRFVRFDAAKSELSDGAHAWRLGDAMRVNAANVDWNRRRIEFVPADAGSGGGRRAERGGPRPAGKKKRRM